MAYTYDVTTDRGKVRLLIGDSDDRADLARVLLQDEEIDSFLTMYGGAVKLAAAAALSRIAIDQALLLKKQRNMDWESDGPALAKVLLAEAERLRTEYNTGVGEGDSATFAVIEQVQDDFSYRQALINAALRGG